MTAGGRRRAALLALALLLGGCATRPPPGSDWLSGRLSLKVDALGSQPARALSTAFELRGNAERGELQLTSPLGTLVAQARWEPGAATLVRADGETRYPDLDALSKDALGEALPLRALAVWLRGKPWDGAENRATPAGFEQLGWQVDLARFADGWLEVSRSAPLPAATLRARLERTP